MIGSGPTHYASGNVSRCDAVAARARAIPQECRTKALRLDHQHCDAEQGAIGPISRKLADNGEIWSLVFKAYGEASPSVHELVRTASAEYASRYWVCCAAATRTMLPL